MTISMSRLLFSLLGLAVATVVSAQQPAGQPAAKPALPDVEMAPSSAFSYEPQDRRDPFVSLVARGSESASNRPKGVTGLLIGEVTVKGIVRDRSGFIAMIQGSDEKTFIVRSGERLMDGSVKAITADTVVFSQDVTDPMSLVKQKEVRKAVRSADGGRG